MKNLRLVVFDFNGIIVADTQACKEADDEVIKAFGGTPPSLSSYRETIVIPAIDFYASHGCDRKRLESSPELMGKTFHEFYEPRAERLRTRRGVWRVLSYLKGKSIPAVILSNHTQHGVEAQLERLNIAHFFAAVLANEAGQTSMVKRNKLGRLTAFLTADHYRPEESLIIGDSPEEIEVGRKLGMMTVGVSGGYYSDRRLRNAADGRGPHYPIISNMVSLLEIFKFFKV